MRSTFMSLFGCALLAAMIGTTTTTALADPLFLDTPAAGTLAASGTMTYTLSVPAPGRLTFTITGWLSTYNWSADIDRAYLYNAAGDPVAIEEFGSATDPFFSHMLQTHGTYSINVGQAGTYTLQIHSGDTWGWPEGRTTQSYTLTASLATVDDAHEPNDTIDTATPLALNTPVTAYQWRMTPTSAVTGDEDMYRVSIPSPGILTITMTGWVSTYNWSADYDRLYIYRADGTQFNYGGEDKNYSWMMGDDASIAVNLSAGGDYCLRLHSGSGTATVPYTLTCSFAPVDDAQEPNDGALQATDASSGVTYTAYQWKSTPQGPVVWADEDWFRFTTGGGDVTITVNGWKSIYNWGLDYDRIYVYRETAPGVAGDQVFTRHMLGSPYTTTLALATGTYLVNLHSGADMQTTPYTLTLDFPGTTSVASDMPASFALDPVSPNPFNGAAMLSFTLPAPGAARLVVYSLTGQTVRTLVDDMLDTGIHRVVWDGRTDDGVMAASGIYIARLSSGGMSRATRMTFMK